MPADKATSGMGPRRQGATDPKQADDSRRSLDRALNQDQESEAAADAWEAGRQPGAHGMQAPHRNVKPGTRLDLEQADTETGDAERS